MRFTKGTINEVKVSVLRNVPLDTKQRWILRVETNASGVSIFRQWSPLIWSWSTSFSNSLSRLFNHLRQGAWWGQCNHSHLLLFFLKKITRLYCVLRCSIDTIKFNIITIIMSSWWWSSSSSSSSCYHHYHHHHHAIIIVVFFLLVIIVLQIVSHVMVVLALYVSMDMPFTKAFFDEVEVSCPQDTKQRKLLWAETNASGVSILRRKWSRLFWL